MYTLSLPGHSDEHVEHFELSSTILEFSSVFTPTRSVTLARSSATSTFSRETLRHLHFLVCDWNVVRMSAAVLLGEHPI